MNIEQKAKELINQGKHPYCLYLVSDWNGDAFYWVVAPFESFCTGCVLLSDFFTRLKSAEYYEIYGSVSFTTGEKIKGDGIVTILPEELSQKGEWLKEYAKKSLKNNKRFSNDGELNPNAHFFVGLKLQDSESEIIDLGE
jgi:hypothetical protein